MMNIRSEAAIMKMENFLDNLKQIYLLFTKLNDIIIQILEDYAKKRFDKFLKEKKIIVKGLEKFSEKITLSQEIPQEFNKNYLIVNQQKWKKYQNC